ncbi:hypothetical protein ACLEIY_15940 [Acetobacter tropicalis]|uniref:hypothetical protein n=1 Tax=Acetobacter tropicalis TaxID=104102 RepID=UPI00397656E0
MSAPRTRKAWTVTIPSRDDATGIEYAPTAGKARYSVYLRISDCDDNASFSDIIVRRNKAADIMLPAPPAFVSGISRKALKELLHACGCTRERPEKTGYRSHFYGEALSGSLNELVRAGLMTKRAPTDVDNGLVYFVATEQGQNVAQSLAPLYPYDDFAWPEAAA